MIEIRLLLAGDDRSKFSSGEALVDTFFHRYAGQNQFRHRIGSTYVAVADGDVLGFVTVAPGEIHVDSLPQEPHLPRYPLPVLRIARLAVDQQHQGRRLGDALLAYALGLALKASNEIGCAGVVVDAKPKAVSFYERYGFHPLKTLDGSLAGAPLTLFLGIHSIVPRDRA